MYQAILETPSFSFQSFGNDESHARDLLREALVRHQDEYGLGEGWVDEILSEDAGNVNYVEFEIGQAYRDYDLLVGDK